MCAHDTRLDRRSVLRGTVVGLFVGVAGCSVPGGEDDDEEDGGGEPEGDGEEGDNGEAEEDEQLQGPEGE